MVAVELNEKMLEREDFSKTPLHEGDRIELHHFMGGGAYINEVTSSQRPDSSNKQLAPGHWQLATVNGGLDL
jgi:hypothetical protein